MIPQTSGTLGDRLDAAFTMVGAPALLVGMDTPQLEPHDVDAAIAALGDPSCDAVLGPAVDGGYWAIGFARPVRGAFRDVPMSTAETFRVQYQRLGTLGLRTTLLPVMRDVDDFGDALEVARLAPDHSVRARAVRRPRSERPRGERSSMTALACLRTADGTLAAAGDAWLAPATNADQAALRRVSAPVLDIGCGPGRHVVALGELGIPVLGIDVTHIALSAARARGALVLERSVFGRVPGAGRWGSALLLDGNLGIGADPAFLLRRVGGAPPPGRHDDRRTGPARHAHVGAARALRGIGCGRAVVPLGERRGGPHRGTRRRRATRRRRTVVSQRSVVRLSHRPRAMTAIRERIHFESRIRNERVAAILGIALGVTFSVCFATGLYSHFLQDQPSWFTAPARPAGLYRFTQGLHVATGLASIPLLFAKLWSVFPKLFAWPPFSGVAQALERLALIPLVGGAVFQLFSGVANINLWYPWPFNFRTSHYWIAWVTIGALIVHIGAKCGHHPHRTRPAGRATRRSPLDDPAAQDRRLFLATVFGASGLLTLLTVGQTARPLARLALLAPRRPDVGPQGFPINRTAAAAGVVTSARDPSYRLVVEGRVKNPLSLSLDDLAALPQHDATLPDRVCRRVECLEALDRCTRARPPPHGGGRRRRAGHRAFAATPARVQVVRARRHPGPRRRHAARAPSRR